MGKSCVASLIACLLCGSAQAQQSVPANDTLEGFWLDSARRILYSRSAPAGYAYGAWTLLEPAQTYPLAKQVRRSAEGWHVADLNFDDADYTVRTVAGNARELEFIRSENWSGCTMHHKCRLDAGEMICALENTCPESGRKAILWRGEERYVRRASCERLGRAQMQGIPVSCR